ncbi:MAG TPA: isoprenylcysteine carboxylmethyltransferase family protein [Jatrophihabitantaceae bacterium]|jgi:protein-S-isoprenylcysteine O-methyltransferase Ste14
MRLTLRSTSTRVLVALPAIVLAEQVVSRRRLHPKWLPVMAWGVAQYKLAGGYRLPRAGGPPGMSQGFPDTLVDNGVYACTRNPMYLGHIIFATGLTLVTRSPVAGAAAAALVPWFRRRVERDERRLVERFGAEYVEYTRRVPRWVPGTRPAPVESAD